MVYIITIAMRLVINTITFQPTVPASADILSSLTSFKEKEEKSPLSMVRLFTHL